jgi:hypothetical protein
MVGCTPAQSLPAPAEHSFGAQLLSVRNGATDQIHVSASPLTDNDFTHLPSAAGLRVLLIDHAESRITTEGVRHLADLSKLEHLRLRGPGIDDAALTQIAKVKSLQILNLPRADLSDSGLPHLKQLPALEQLRFGSPRVTDAGMKTIRELPALKRLHLIDIPISDKGLAELTAIEQLESLYIDGGDFSDAALDELFRARPGLHVHLNQKHHDRDPRKHEH